MSKKANQDIKQLRAIGHKLKPVVTIAGKGLTEGVINELDRALTDHEPAVTADDRRVPDLHADEVRDGVERSRGTVEGDAERASPLGDQVIG